ncbi:PRC-barrel domain-containing protein [Streptacidiphilus sp. PAMC 29251]
MENGVWGYQENSGYQAGTDLSGYKVEATDGHIGKVDKHSADVDAQYIVVDTGPWIFGKHVLLPAGTITSVDADNQTVQVGRTKEEIKNSPEFDKDKHTGDADYHQQVGTYYGNSTRGV